MNYFKLFLLGLFAATTLCGCNNNPEKKLHDKCVEIFKAERINEVKTEIESIEREIKLCEYLLNIEDDKEFMKVVEFIEEKTEDSKSWNAEFETLTKELELKSELAENKADEAELQMDAKAASLDL